MGFFHLNWSLLDPGWPRWERTEMVNFIHLVGRLPHAFYWCQWQVHFHGKCFHVVSYELCWDLEILCASVLSHFSRVWLFVTPQTVARQAPLSMRSSGKSTGMVCHVLLQEIFSTRGSRGPSLLFLRDTLYNPQDKTHCLHLLFPYVFCLMEHFCCERFLSMFLPCVSNHGISVNWNAWRIGCLVHWIFRAPTSDHKNHVVSSLVVNVFPKMDLGH